VLFYALPLCRYSYIGRQQRGEVQNWEVQRYRYAVIQRFQRWGRGGAPLPIFLMLNLLEAEELFCPSIWAL